MPFLLSKTKRHGYVILSGVVPAQQRLLDIAGKICDINYSPPVIHQRDNGDDKHIDKNIDVEMIPTRAPVRAESFTPALSQFPNLIFWVVVHIVAVPIV